MPINQARMLVDRAAAASKFVSDTGFSWPVLCDGIDNDFHTKFGAWPTRYYVVQDGKLRYKIEHNSEIRFDINELRTAVADAVADTATTTVPAIAALGDDDTATRV